MVALRETIDREMTLTMISRSKVALAQLQLFYDIICNPNIWIFGEYLRSTNGVFVPSPQFSPWLASVRPPKTRKPIARYFMPIAF